MRQPRLRDIDGTVYDPDTGLPVAREVREWRAVVDAVRRMPAASAEPPAVAFKTNPIFVPPAGTKVSDLTVEIGGLGYAPAPATETFYELDTTWMPPTRTGHRLAGGGYGDPIIASVTHRVLREVRGLPVVVNCEKAPGEPWVVTFDDPEFSDVVVRGDDLETAISAAVGAANDQAKAP